MSEAQSKEYLNKPADGAPVAVERRRKRMCGKLVRLGAALVVTAMLVWAGGAAGQQGAPINGEWRRIGGDGGNTRYSPLDQINAQNVKDLKVAWTWKGDNF